MPRLARVRSVDSIYHVMCRSISEVKLFKDDNDKCKYLEYVKKYQNLHGFKVYSYCLMKNHVHFIIDSNGADISQIMHGINFSYARYFNTRHKRHGHLFQDRFKSKVINSDNYLITASAYIHNNATALRGYKRCPEDYRFSSLAVYLGICFDTFDLIEPEFILDLFGRNADTAKENYYAYVFKCDSKGKAEFEFAKEPTLYVNQRVIRKCDLNAQMVLEHVSQQMNIPITLLSSKYNRKLTRAKALLVVMLKSRSSMNATQICQFIGDITQANIARLTKIGVEMLVKEQNTRRIFEAIN